MDDFIRHMDLAAKKVGIQEDFKGWCDTWLRTAGCNTLWHDVQTDKAGKITKFTVHQGIHKNGENNQLRQQKYRVNFFDKNMKVVDGYDVLTSAKDATVELKEPVGKPAPFAYHINAGNYGYGKFKIGASCLTAFEGNLAKIEDPMARKQLLGIMYDMTKENDLSGAQLFEICCKQVVAEEDIAVLTEVFSVRGGTFSSVLGNLVPPEHAAEFSARLFDLALAKLKASTKLDKATRQLILDAVIGSASTREQLNQLRAIFDACTSKVEAKSGDGERIELTSMQKHAIVKRFHSSTEAQAAEHEALMAAIEAIPDGKDNLEDTKRFCEAAVPTAKEAMWAKYFDFSDESPIKDWGLHAYAHSFSGFNQGGQKKELAPFVHKFFAQIREVFEKKGRFVAEQYFMKLKPTGDVSKEGVARYESLLAEVREHTPDRTQLIKEIRDAISLLNMKREGQEASRKWLSEQKKK